MGIIAPIAQDHADLVNGVPLPQDGQHPALRDHDLAEAYPLTTNDHVILLGPNDSNNNEEPYIYSPPDQARPSGPYFIPSIKSIFEGAENRELLNKTIESVLDRVSKQNNAPPSKSRRSNRKKFAPDGPEQLIAQALKTRTAVLKRQAKKEPRRAKPPARISAAMPADVPSTALSNTGAGGHDQMKAPAIASTAPPETIAPVSSRRHPDGWPNGLPIKFVTAPPRKKNTAAEHVAEEASSPRSEEEQKANAARRDSGIGGE